MPRLTSTKGARDVFVPDEDTARWQGMVNSGDYQIADGETASVVDPYGHQTVVGHDVLAKDSARGVANTYETQEKVVQRAREKRLEDQTSTAGSFVRGGLSGLSFGVTDELFDEETIEADQIHHGTARGVGMAAGMVGPLFVGNPRGLFGGAQLAEDALTAERSISALSSRYLHAGEVGGEAASIGKSVERGLIRGRQSIAERGRAMAVPEELAALDAKGLRAAEVAERESLAAAQVARRAEAAEAIKGYRATVKEANPWLVVDAGEDAAKLNQSNRTIRSLLNDPVGLAERPEAALKALRVQEQALLGATADAEAIAARLAKGNRGLARGLEEELATLPNAATHVDLTGKAARRYASFADVKVTGKGADAAVKVTKEEAERFLGALKGGDLATSESKALSKLPELLDANRTLQSQIKAASVPKSELASERLQQILEARDTLGTAAKAQPKTWLEHAAGGAAFSAGTALAAPLGPIAPIVGAKAASLASDALFGRLAKATADVADRSRRAVDAFVTVGKGAAKASPVLATQVLARARFAPPTRNEEPASTPHQTALAPLFRARTAEIRAQTMPGPDGRMVMRPEARLALGARFDAVREASPILADLMETVGARQIEFLASRLPKRPDMGLQLGPDRWQPSDMEMRVFARYVAAVEDPGGIEERLSHGTVTPEDAEVMREVYPERFAAIQLELATRLPELRQQLPYERRLALSIFSGVPVDPSMQPEILAVLQGNYTAEPGTDGGAHAPTPRPQFGSVKKLVETEATPSQARAGL